MPHSPYPPWPSPSIGFRVWCTVVASLAVVGGFLQLRSSNPFVPGVAVLIGLAFLALGIYGRIPLVPSVRGWHPPTSPETIDDTHRAGLRTLRHRKWLMLASIPAMFVVAFAALSTISVGALPTNASRVLVPTFIVFVVGPVLYFNSRCPRCGHSFFRSASRTLDRRRKKCGHCGLPLDADKGPKDS